MLKRKHVTQILNKIHIPFDVRVWVCANWMMSRNILPCVYMHFIAKLLYYPVCACIAGVK